MVKVRYAINFFNDDNVWKKRMRKITICCAGDCGKFINLSRALLKKCDFYFCGSSNCRDNVKFKVIDKLRERAIMSTMENVAGSFFGLDFYTEDDYSIRYGLGGEQLLYEHKTHHLLFIPRQRKIRLSQRSDKEIVSSLSNIILPKLYLEEQFKGIGEAEIFKNIENLLGSSMDKKIKKIKTGEFDHLDS